MTKEVIEELLDKAGRLLLDKDDHLLKVNSSEVSLTHKLAIYIENLIEYYEDIRCYDVDIEYNRDGENPKEVADWISTNCEKCKRPRPDIIIHKRGTNDNLVVIEAKKDASSHSKDEDKRKLRQYLVSSLKYKYAFFIDFKTGSSLDFKIDPVEVNTNGNI